MNPEIIVQKQLDAFNARNIEALLSIYAADAEFFEHPATLLAKGRNELRNRFQARFSEPNLKATLVNRIICGNKVIDQERLIRTFTEGPGELELTMIYEIQGEEIIKAWSIIGPKLLY
jgi:hypothetical protein